MIEKDFIPGPSGDLPDAGTFSWKAPSNIALVKYWGKLAGQIPTNPSVSFTLDTSATRTTLICEKTMDPGEFPHFSIYLDGAPAPHFSEKIRTFFERILPYQPFLSEYAFEIRTENTFPHSSGIASSASGMAALSLCLMDLELKIYPDMSTEFFHHKASFLARLGSGSAARSIKGGVVQWGEHDAVPGSSNLYGISYPFEVHPVFESFQDTILLVDKGKKEVSSTVGHALMQGHPFAKSRFDQARKHIDQLRPVFREGDLNAFMALVESEALSLHAMMMSSNPYFILMKPGTLEIIERIWEYRRRTGHAVCFTLDAGANVHLLYPGENKETIQAFLKEELVSFCQDGHYLLDRVGPGASRL
ncbi:diphosphomevalonate/mevalonate 3,5-bisphosphate decarboxylase family protein [Robiginitalea aurantiaca]|uniref:Diphosphomevalonate decarboxylase n=1 Tax=Robiginitalea aurantiaca TaxID=3056915 RepID=A0ABT7WET6_9FLAO|nr:diphosphomevalonate decarboxylase [Robiginitalea aurantiaca]MDM9631427.1 diphosphomevalonate decarboxylase [Robiginitalea aurantiaca]